MKSQFFTLLTIILIIAQDSFCQETMFNEVHVGNQIWMSKNLNVDCFQNGDKIIEVKSLEEWNLAIANEQPAWCYYKNKKSSEKKYGKLYNYFALIDSRGLAPQGWHIPSVDEWNVFIDSIGENGSLFSIFEGNNDNKEIGFNAVFAGCRDNSLNFIDADQWTYWWATVDNSSSDCKVLAIQPSYYSIFVDVKSGFSAENWEDGFSVRCIKNIE